MCEDDIQKCLNCPKPKCTNCLRETKPYENKKKKNMVIVQINPETGETVAIHKSYREAAEAADTSERHIRRYTGTHSPIYRGYLWRRVEVKRDNV